MIKTPIALNDTERQCSFEAFNDVDTKNETGHDAHFIRIDHHDVDFTSADLGIGRTARSATG